MNKFEKVKKYFDNGLWDETRIKNAVVKKWITEDEYEIIVANTDPEEFHEIAETKNEEKMKELEESGDENENT